ncbi:MAG: ORF6N domain-containing protein [Desulfobacteraceae bacterium]|nr:ORF6N domain-containing protein [Desulfobacteraceae bacterium]
MKPEIELVPIELIQSKIVVLRGERALIDRDLAELYGVSTKALNQAATRNRKRFPPDFMFRLLRQEKEELVTNCDRFHTLKHSTVMPRAFTEQGVAMLSSVLNSDRAIEVNIAIMRAFVQLRKISSSQTQLVQKLQEIEARLGDHDESIEAIFEAIQQLITPPVHPRKRIGFEVKESKARYGKRTREKRR